MNILVVGTGRVGIRLIGALEHLGHDVSAVEEDPVLLSQLNSMTNPFQGTAVRGVPIDIDVLRAAGIDACDAVAAVTKDDNINIMVAQMAKTVFGVQNVIARVADPVAKKVYSERFGLHAVCGTNLTAQAFVTGLLYDRDGTDDEDTRLTIGSSTAEFTIVPVAKENIGKKLVDVALSKDETQVFGVLRASGVLELALDTSILLHVGDSIVFAQIVD